MLCNVIELRINSVFYGFIFSFCDAVFTASATPDFGEIKSTVTQATGNDEPTSYS